jgi:hypothetical protein
MDHLPTDILASSKINQNRAVEIEEGLNFLKNKVILPG